MKQQKHAEELANLLLSAEFAKNYEAWMKAYKKCLEIVTLWELRNHFSQETDTGCVRKYKVNEPTKETGLKVEVTFDVKEDERDTLQKTCSKDDLDQDDIPCEDCDWQP